MREVYGLELWWALTPWVLLVVAVIACAFLWHMVKVLNRSNGKAQAKAKELEAGMTRANENRFKAEAEAREATAAHAKCSEELKRKVADIYRWQKTCEELTDNLGLYHEKISRLTPRRNKQGRYAPKGKARS